MVNTTICVFIHGQVNLVGRWLGMFIFAISWPPHITIPPDHNYCAIPTPQFAWSLKSVDSSVFLSAPGDHSKKVVIPAGLSNMGVEECRSAADADRIFENLYQVYPMTGNMYQHTAKVSCQQVAWINSHRHLVRSDSFFSCFIDPWWLVFYYFSPSTMYIYMILIISN